MTTTTAVTPGLTGRVAMVTGGSRGIGAATAAQLAAHGAMVGVGGRDEAAIDQVVTGIRAAGGHAIAVPADATEADALTAAYTTLERHFGPVELLAAFAGGNGSP